MITERPPPNIASGSCARRMPPEPLLLRVGHAKDRAEMRRKHRDELMNLLRSNSDELEELRAEHSNRLLELTKHNRDAVD